jgi:membrane associated rhomboid family serine protease
MELSITLVIVIITCLVSIGGLSNGKIVDDLIFYGPAISRRNQWHRMLTHGLIHGDAFHLIFNMVALYSFGTMLEKTFVSSCLFGSYGKIIFLALYIGGLIVASLPDLFKHKDDYHFKSLGASGAVSAVILATVVLMPTTKISLFILPIGIPGYIFAVLYIGISAYLDKRGSGNINHGAHLWGAIFGLIFTITAVHFFGQLDLIDNFKQQMGSDRPIIWVGC